MVSTKKERKRKRKYYNEMISNTQGYINRLKEKLNLTLENTQDNKMPTVEKCNGIKPMSHEFEPVSAQKKRVLKNEENK